MFLNVGVFKSRLIQSPLTLDCKSCPQPQKHSGSTDQVALVGNARLHGSPVSIAWHDTENILQLCAQEAGHAQGHLVGGGPRSTTTQSV